MSRSPAAPRRLPLARRRRVFEALGWKRYSRPALHDIDRKLERYLGFDGGFFVEAGANDGYTQSNTYYLERFRGWRGVLVEPLPELAEACRKERPHSRVFCCALVPPGQEGTTVPMLAANLMSLVRGAQKSPEGDAEHCRRAAAVQQLEVSEIEVPARTLTSVLDEVGPPRIDFLSLDVEGYERQVLDGLDLVRYRPRYVLVEARFRDEIDRRLGADYVTVAELSHHDVLYAVKTGHDGRGAA